jgi:AcrR family transcriptional regulator
MTPSSEPDLKPHQSGFSHDQARERILRTAYDLFCRHGLQAVGIDRIVAEAGVAKMTLYRNFRSKGELILAVLERREEVWTREWLGGEIERRGGTVEERLLAIFDAFDEWFNQSGYEGCLFINALLESHDVTSPIGAACATRLANVRSLIDELAEEAGIRDRDDFARQFQILLSGSIVAASAGDVEAARRARVIAQGFLEQKDLGQ